MTLFLENCSEGCHFEFFQVLLSGIVNIGPMFIKNTQTRVMAILDWFVDSISLCYGALPFKLCVVA